MSNAVRELKQFMERENIVGEIRERRRHYAVYIGGKMVAVASRGKDSGGMRGYKNLFASIKRAARESDFGAQSA